MKRTITYLAFFLIVGFIQAQAPPIEWQKTFGGTTDDITFAIQNTPDGGYIAAGSSNSNNGDVTTNHGDRDYWVIKMGATGTIQWQKSLGGSAVEASGDIQLAADGGYIVAGNSESINGDIIGNHGHSDCWVVKLDTNGNVAWQKCLGGSENDFCSSIQTTPDGGCIISGSTGSNDGDVTVNHGNTDYWVVKLNSSGNIQWQKTYGGSNFDDASSIQLTLDGGYIVTGNSNSSNGDVTGNQGDADFWVIKLDATGNLQWQKTLGGSGTDSAADIQITPDGGYIVAGHSNSNNGDVTGNHGGYDYWIAKLDAQGDLQWQKSLGGTGLDLANSIHTTAEGGYVVAGLAISNDGDITGNHGASDYWVVKLDPTGTTQWQKCFGGSVSEVAYSIQPTPDNGYAIAGYSLSNNGDVTGNHGNYDSWIVKLATDQMGTPDFENDDLVIYPNPVCDVLQIQMPNNTTISTVRIVTVNGQVVVEQTQNSNTINVEKLAQGVYIVEVYSGERMYTAKFVKE